MLQWIYNFISSNYQLWRTTTVRCFTPLAAQDENCVRLRVFSVSHVRTAERQHEQVDHQMRGSDQDQLLSHTLQVSLCVYARPSDRWGWGWFCTWHCGQTAAERGFWETAVKHVTWSNASWLEKQQESSWPQQQVGVCVCVCHSLHWCRILFNKVIKLLHSHDLQSLNIIKRRSELQRPDSLRGGDEEVRGERRTD